MSSFARFAKIPSFVLAVALLAGVEWSAVRAADAPPAGRGGRAKPAPGPSGPRPVKDIMKQAFKGDDSLFKRVESGKATKEDKARLAALTTELLKYPAPKGDAAGWKTKTEALAKATKAVNDESPNALASLKAAANCKACHSQHKPM